MNVTLGIHYSIHILTFQVIVYCAILLTSCCVIVVRDCVACLNCIASVDSDKAVVLACPPKVLLV